MPMLLSAAAVSAASVCCPLLSCMGQVPINHVTFPPFVWRRTRGRYLLRQESAFTFLESPRTASVSIVLRLALYALPFPAQQALGLLLP